MDSDFPWEKAISSLPPKLIDVISWCIRNADYADLLAGLRAASCDELREVSRALCQNEFVELYALAFYKIYSMEHKNDLL